MKIGISLRYAFRSLIRHPRRSILSVAGVGIGCGLCLVLIGWVGGEKKTFMRAAVQSGAGHIRIAPKGWNEKRENDLRLANGAELRQEMQRLPGIKAVTPHARTDGLLGFGTRTAGVQILGVDPRTERETSRIVRKFEGTYLKPGSTGSTVIGSTIAQRLDVEIGDDLMVTVSGKGGQMSSAMLRIVGIINTGSRDMDATICHVTIEEVEKLTGRSGLAELTMLVDNPDRLNAMTATVRNAISDDYEVLTWEQLVPELASSVEVDKAFTNMTVGILMFVVFLGIASSQLAAVLERRREFAVLSALGMRGRRLILILVLEGFVLGAAGSLTALAVGTPASYYLATKGVDMSKVMSFGEQKPDLYMSDMLFDPIFYGDFGIWIIPYAVFLALTATMLSSLYPAWFAMRTNPATALRVEN